MVGPSREIVRGFSAPTCVSGGVDKLDGQLGKVQLHNLLHDGVAIPWRSREDGL